MRISDWSSDVCSSDLPWRPTIAVMWPRLDRGHVDSRLQLPPPVLAQIEAASRRADLSRLGPVPAPCRTGSTVSAAARLRLAIRRVSPPFLTCAPCREGAPPPPRSAPFAALPAPASPHSGP